MFGAPNYQVRQAKKLLKDKGILSSVNQRPGKNLPAKTADLIKLFYECDQLSRPMPGMKDCNSIKKIMMEKELRFQKGYCFVI